MKKLNVISEKKLLPFVYRKSWSALLLAGIVFITIAALYSCNTTQEKGGDIKQKSEAVKIVAFGGTVTAGTSAKLDVSQDCFKWGTTEVNMVRKTQTWWAISERILRDWVDGGVEVISAGSAGNTASKGAGRLEDDVLSHSPDYVLVMFGMDDALAGVEADNFREDLKKIVTRIKEEKVNVVLMTPPPISERMTINCTMDELRGRQAHLSGLVQVIRDLTKEKSLPLIDIYQYFLDNSLAYDHLFEGWLPDAVAQTAMAPFVSGKLLPVMGVDNYPNPTLDDYRKVYSDSKTPLTKHNGFTDLTYFKGEFFLAFRTGLGHGVPAKTSSKSEAIMVLRSRDGINWTEDALLKVKGRDNRDPKFLQANGQLMVYTFCSCVTPCSTGTISYGFERLDNGKWSEPFECAPGVFWRPKKWRDQYVVANYSGAHKDASVKLFSSEDGRNWNEVSNILSKKTNANETDLLIEGDKLMAYARCGEGNDHAMMVCTYIPDENRWETVSTGRLIHGPCVFKVGGITMITGRYCSQSDEGFKDLRKDWNAFNSGDNAKMDKADPARVEEYHHGLRSGVFVIKDAKPRLVMELLSVGDSGYSGVVEYGNEYVISDYSMHEYYPEIKRPGDWNTPSDIYISRIRFGQTGI
ncbi:MAG: GDSL-type esterase/lipase family protein [Bacteroidota bacterium]|nr:GDSL-type esterase/lipase family protein [Bacteroidota bacterium]